MSRNVLADCLIAGTAYFAYAADRPSRAGGD